MPRPPRFVVRVDGAPLSVTLPLERAERVARRAVSQHGRHDLAEILEGDTPVITYARITEKENTQP